MKGWKERRLSLQIFVEWKNWTENYIFVVYPQILSNITASTMRSMHFLYISGARKAGKVVKLVQATANTKQADTSENSLRRP